MSSTKIKIDTIGDTINTLTDSKLTNVGLPVCFGSMIPPIIMKNVSFNNTDLFAHKHSITDDDIYDSNIKNYVTDYDESLNDMVLTKKGVAIIETYKESVASMFAAQLLKCSTCEYFEICNMLTKNYLKAIELNELTELNEVTR